MHPQIIRQAFTTVEQPAPDLGGYIEERDGELMLRLADCVTFLGDRWRVERSWQREPNPLWYPMAPEEWDGNLFFPV